MAKAAFKKKKTLFTRQLYFNLRGKTLLKCYIWSMAWFRAVTWTLQKVDQKYGAGERWRR